VKKEKVREKGFLIAKIPSIKGFPPDEARDNNKLWPRKIPSIEGFPPKRPETTTSCGLEKSHPRRDSHQKVRMMISRKRMSKGSPVYSHLLQIVENFSGIIIIRKGQGTPSDVHKKSWLKQLRVAISTEASLPIGPSPQNSKNKFCRLAQRRSKFSKIDEDFS
jgi:hypothetical protein